VAYTNGLSIVTYDNTLGYNNVVTDVQDIVYNPSGVICITLELGPGTSVMLDHDAGLLRVCATNLLPSPGPFTPSTVSTCADYTLRPNERVVVMKHNVIDTITISVSNC
jgi:hypothetical protein